MLYVVEYNHNIGSGNVGCTPRQANIGYKLGQQKERRNIRSTQIRNRVCIEQSNWHKILTCEYHRSSWVTQLRWIINFCHFHWEVRTRQRIFMFKKALPRKQANKQTKQKACEKRPWDIIYPNLLCLPKHAKTCQICWNIALHSF